MSGARIRLHVIGNKSVYPPGLVNDRAIKPKPVDIIAKPWFF